MASASIFKRLGGKKKEKQIQSKHEERSNNNEHKNQLDKKQK